MNLLDKIEEDVAQIVWLSKNIENVVYLMDNYGEDITLKDLFKKISEEKKKLFKEINDIAKK